MSKYSYRTVKKLILGTLLAATIYAAQAITAEGASVNLAWNASAGPGVTGYKVHYGTVSHNYTVEIDAGNSTAASAANLTVGTSYYIAVAAYNASGVESPYSNEVVYVPAAPTPTPAPTSTPTPTRTPTPAPTSTPTPTPVQGPLSIAGNVSYCSDSASNPVSNVILTRTGTTGGSVTSDSFGNYQFPPLLLGIYTVTPTKTALAPGASGINTADVVAIRRQYLGVAPLQGCQLAAANVNGDSTVNTTDVLAVQKFFLGQTNAIANAGKFQFTPANRTYVSLLGSLPGQDYGTLVLGDVIAPFADRPETQTQSAATSGRVEVALPEVAIDQTVTTFTVQATATNVDVGDQLVGFQGDFTFDETVVSFQDDPIESAGLTENNWTVAANVLPGEGPIRTLRISAFSNDLIPLSGSGPLFNLKMVRGGDPSGASTTLNWVEANPFIFIDANLTPKAPEALGAGSIILE